MTLVGKILVLLNLVMSFIFMAFALLVYETRVDLRNEMTKVKSDLDKAQVTARGFEEEKQAALKQLAEQKEAMQKSESEAARQIADLRKNLETVSTQLNETRKESSSSMAELGTATKEQQQRRDEVAALREAREQLLAKNADLTNKNNSLQDQLAQTTNDLQLVNARNEQMLNRIRELEGYVVRFKGTLPDEAELRAGQDVPPPPNVEGVVTKIDKTGKFIQISLGEDDGIHKGQVLEVWRTKPEPKYLGRIRIDLTDATTAVAKPVSVTGLIQENDRVGARILVSGN